MFAKTRIRPPKGGLVRHGAVGLAFLLLAAACGDGTPSEEASGAAAAAATIDEAAPESGAGSAPDDGGTTTSSSIPLGEGPQLPGTTSGSPTIVLGEGPDRPIGSASSSTSITLADRPGFELYGPSDHGNYYPEQTNREECQALLDAYWDPFEEETLGYDYWLAAYAVLDPNLRLLDREEYLATGDFSESWVAVARDWGSTTEEAMSLFFRGARMPEFRDGLRLLRSGATGATLCSWGYGEVRSGGAGDEEGAYVDTGWYNFFYLEGSCEIDPEVDVTIVDHLWWLTGEIVAVWSPSGDSGADYKGHPMILGVPECLVPGS